MRGQLLSNQMGPSPSHSKAGLLTSVVGKKSAAFIAGCQARSSGQLVFKKAKTPYGFQEGI